MLCFPHNSAVKITCLLYMHHAHQEMHLMTFSDLTQPTVLCKHSRPLQKKITRKQFAELLKGFQNFCLHHQRKPPKREEAIWVGVGNITNTSYCCQHPTSSGWLVTQCGGQLRESLSWCLKKKIGVQICSQQVTASILTWAKWAELPPLPSPHSPLAGFGFRFILRLQHETKTKMGAGRCGGTATGCTPGPDWMGSVLLGPKIALWVFFGM